MLERGVHRCFIKLSYYTNMFNFIEWVLIASHLVMHASENKQFNDHCMGLNISCLRILIHILHPNLLNSTLPSYFCSNHYTLVVDAAVLSLNN